MEGGSQSALDGLQIGASAVFSLGKNAANNRFTSRAISRWIAAAVCFPDASTAAFPLHGAKSADLFVDTDQILAQLLQAVELGDLLLRFAQRRWIGKGLGRALARDPAGQPELRIVTRIIGFGAMAGRLTAVCAPLP
jgi:hypothetical protein